MAAAVGLGRGKGAEVTLPKEELERMAAAIPEKAWAKPRKPRRLMIFERNVNYGGHRSIATATAAFRMMGEETGAFSVVSGSDPEMFRREYLATFDGVFFNNNVGNLFTEAELREGLVDFVYGGGGLMGVHGATVAFTQWPGAIEDWPEFGLMIGARGANHRESTEAVVMKVEEPGHPLVRAFAGTQFEYRDEYFRVHAPYSRQRLRVLLSMDLERMLRSPGPAYGQVERADKDYAVAWAREYGRGRCFYCTIGHNPYVFWEPVLLSFYLAAVQFILGDWAAPVTPSGRLTPAVRALERLGWRLGFCGAGEKTVFGGIEGAERLGLLCTTAAMLQPVAWGGAQLFDPSMSREQRRQVRFKLDAAGVRLLACEAPELPAEAAGCREVLGFARRMGCELVVAPASRVADWERAGRWAREMEVRLALRPDGARPLEEARAFGQRAGEEVGVWWDCNYGVARKVSPRRAVEGLGRRMLGVEVGRPEQVEECLGALRSGQVAPVMVAVSLGGSTEETVRACERVVMELAS